MTGISELTLPGIVAAVDFGRYPTIVDVGGGEGRLLAEILRRAPHSTGTVFDQPAVVNRARAAGAGTEVANRMSFVAGSFFDTSPPPGADAYLLKSILHDWTDEQCRVLLANIRAAMPEHATLIVVEQLLPERPQPGPGYLIDLEMLVSTGGHERTEAQYRQLLATAGFELTEVAPAGGGQALLHARPA